MSIQVSECTKCGEIKRTKACGIPGCTNDSRWCEMCLGGYFHLDPERCTGWYGSAPNHPKCLLHCACCPGELMCLSTQKMNTPEWRTLLVELKDIYRNRPDEYDVLFETKMNEFNQWYHQECV